MNPLSHLVVLAKSIGSSFPVTSGIVTAINEYVPSAHDRANQQLSEAILEKLKSSEDRITEEYVRTDEFVDLLKNCTAATQRTQHDEKYQAVANILANALLTSEDEDKLPIEELSLFSRCVETITLEATHVLATLIELDDPKPVQRTSFGALSHRWESVDVDLLLALVKELAGFHLVTVEEPSVQRSGYANYTIKVTPLGHRFAEHILPAVEAK